MPSCIVLGLRVPELHDYRWFTNPSTVGLLKAVTPAWVTVSFTLVIDYTGWSGSIKILQAKVKSRFSVAPSARSRVP